MYGTRFYGVLEANYSICATHLVTFLLGPAFWRERIPLALPLATTSRGLLLGGHLGPDISELSPRAAGCIQHIKHPALHIYTFIPHIHTFIPHIYTYRPVLFQTREVSQYHTCIVVSPLHSGIADLSLVFVSSAGVLQGCHNIYRVLWVGGHLPQEVGGWDVRSGVFLFILKAGIYVWHAIS